MFIAALFIVAKAWKQLICPLIDDWIKSVGYVYTWNIIQPLEKGEILPFVTTWMDLEIIMLREISQTEKVENHMILFICGM